MSAAPSQPVGAAMSVREEYIRQLREEAPHWPKVPSVTVELDNVSYVMKLPETKVSFASILKECAGCARSLARVCGDHGKQAHSELVHLQNFMHPYDLAVQINRDIETFGTNLIGMAKFPYTIVKSVVDRVRGVQNKGLTEFHVLHKCSATFRPGTMTLILSPPGHGKTNFLVSAFVR
jgi:hypothetical protein